MRPVGLLLAGTGVALSGLCVAGLLDDVRPAAAALVVPEMPLAPVPMPGGAPQERPSGGYVAAILARPLFAEGRRPFGPGPGGAVVEAALPRLTAIVAAPGVRRAIFAPRGDARPIAAGEGDRVGAFRVVAIGAGSVELDGSAGRTTLRLEADQAFRSRFAGPAPLVDPVRREAETESDQ